MEKKKLLIYAHYYYPDVASTGQILQELAEGLQEDFEVSVICTVPSYTGVVEEKYKTQKFYEEALNGVRILRIRVPEFSKDNKFSRIKNVLAYYFGARKLTRRIGRQDYVFTISQPPVLGGMLGVYGKKKCKAKFIYNVQDFNPEQIMAVKYAGNRLVHSVLMLLDKRSCRRADKVIVVGRDMVETLKKRFAGKPLPSYTMINNWTDEKSIYPLPFTNERVAQFRKRYGLEGKFVVMYSGNLGLYYDLLNLLKLSERYKGRTDVLFFYVGQGSMEKELKEYAVERKMENVIFAPYQKKEDLVYSLNAADLHWVVNAKGIKGISVPSKLYGVMAAGKPVLGVLDEGSEARLIIEESGCGLVASPTEYDKIAQLLDAFIEGRADGVEMGRKGRAYLEENLTKDVSVRRYKEEIKGC